MKNSKEHKRTEATQLKSENVEPKTTRKQAKTRE